jgi:hypothetical protein
MILLKCSLELIHNIGQARTTKGRDGQAATTFQAFVNGSHVQMKIILSQLRKILAFVWSSSHHMRRLSYPNPKHGASQMFTMANCFPYLSKNSA